MTLIKLINQIAPFTQLIRDFYHVSPILEFIMTTCLLNIIHLQHDDSIDI